MHFAHAYRVTLYLLLGLPGLDTFAERVTCWECACGQSIVMVGSVPMGTPLHMPADWDAASQAEQRQGTPEAREAARQMRWRL